MRSRPEPSPAAAALRLRGIKRAGLLFTMLVVVLLGGSEAARADTTTALPITGLSAIVVDDTGGVLSTASEAPGLLLANRGAFEYGSVFYLYDIAGPAPQLLSQKGSMTVAELMPDGASALTARLNQEGLYEGPTPEIYP